MINLTYEIKSSLLGMQMTFCKIRPIIAWPSFLFRSNTHATYNSTRCKATLRLQITGPSVLEIFRFLWENYRKMNYSAIYKSDFFIFFQENASKKIISTFFPTIFSGNRLENDYSATFRYDHLIFSIFSRKITKKKIILQFLNAIFNFLPIIAP